LKIKHGMSVLFVFIGQHIYRLPNILNILQHLKTFENI